MTRRAHTTEPLLVGLHSIVARLNRNAATIAEIVVAKNATNPRIRTLLAQARTAGIAIRVAESPAAMPGHNQSKQSKQSEQATATIVAVIKPVSDHPNPPAMADWLATLPATALLLVLDQIQDPHNLGACLRSAEGAGVDAVILPKAAACPITSTVTKIASGAVDGLIILRVANLHHTLRRLAEHNFWIYGAAGEADTNVYQCQFSGRVALVVGGEGRGLRRLTRESCDHLVHIPMHGTVENLNVSVATGILLFEIVRQLRPNLHPNLISSQQ